MAEMTLQELAALVDGELLGDGGKIVSGVATLEDAGEDEISFLANQKYAAHIETTRAAAVIVGKDYAGAQQNLIRCGDPYFAYREAMVAFYGFRRPTFEGISEMASIAPSASVASGVTVAPFVTISADATIETGTVLYPGVFVAPRSRIGRDCVLYPNVTLYDGTILGDRVIIHAGSSIGQDGFGYAPHKDPNGVIRHEKIPPAGWVELGSDVEIGACCVIERATMGSTVIGEGTKFADVVAIGHGTKIGKHCLFVSQCGIAGSTIVGNYCVFAGQAGVVGHIRIGDGARIGAQSGVSGDLEPGMEVLGSPAIPLPDARRAMVAATRLPELRNQIKRLTREMKILRDRLSKLEAPAAEPDE